MNSATHPISPEEVMALLDGELSADETQTIQDHVESCVECASLAEQFRETSQMLALWNVEPVPLRVESAVTSVSTNGGPVRKSAKSKLVSRPGFWSRKPWIFGSAGAFAALLLIIATYSSMSYRNQRMMSYLNPEIANQNATQSAPSIDRMQAAEPAPPPPPVPALHYARPDDKVVSELSTPPAPTPSPMIARTVSLTIVVKDFSASRTTLDAILAKYRGYSAQLTINTPENAGRSFQASLRIPAPQLTAALAELKAIGRVESETQSGEEVTQQHADLEARLKTARDTEERFRTILQQRTGKVDEVLQVEEEIARVRGEIESMEAEQKALEHRVDFATVDLLLNEQYQAQLNSSAASVSNRMHNAFVAGYHNATGTVLAIALFFVEYGPTLLVLAIVFGIPALLIRRRYRKIRERL
jgi:hypothetical protein